MTACPGATVTVSTIHEEAAPVFEAVFAPEAVVVLVPTVGALPKANS